MTPEEIPFLDSDATFSIPRSRLDAFGSRHHRHARHGFPEGLAEVCLCFVSLLSLFRVEHKICFNASLNILHHDISTLKQIKFHLDREALLTDP